MFSCLMSNLLDDCFILHAVKLINNQFPRKKGFFSKKFQTIKDVLSWSSEFVGSSISKSDDKLVKKNACCIFKKIQIYMYDRPARAYTRNKVRFVAP
ncbi:hypothetical protein GJ496_003010 [Pomphorhynchus laevis]|nr:hypothetical protein GJ496_003010 [Pomphorhynchus laevis]